MTDIKKQAIASELLAGNFKKAGTIVNQLTDPLVDTPMVVTIEELKPYELNPRIMRNPLYDDIKASIRERGLDAPPAITRRPGESHYIIRNGGNTRLSILRELWSETKDERFFRIHCLFRPWQNEIAALAGHLVENELHGQLTFIERALAVVKMSELYEHDLGVTLNQKQLAQKLTGQGYPITEGLVSQMKEAVNYLLPVIPDALYGGFSRTQVKRVLSIRKIIKDIWRKYEESSSEKITQTFDDVFVGVLAQFDGKADSFSIDSLQDTLTSEVAKIFKLTYEYVVLDLSEKEARQTMLESPATPLETKIDEAKLFGKATSSGAKTRMTEQEIISTPLPAVYRNETKKNKVEEESCAISDNLEKSHQSLSKPSQEDTDLHSEDETDHPLSDMAEDAFIEAHIVSPVQTTARLDAIQGMVGAITGETPQDFKSNVLNSIPIQAGGLHPISDLWYINAQHDHPEQLRVHIGQLVREIADELDVANHIETIETDLGFRCHALLNEQTDEISAFVIGYLETVSSPQKNEPIRSDYLNAFFTGNNADMPYLSDVAFVKLMRVFRLLRRYWELQNN